MLLEQQYILLNMFLLNILALKTLPHINPIFKNDS